MEQLTPLQIADKADHLNGNAHIACINRLYREQDESHLYPINGKFNVTERAIRQASDIRRQTEATAGIEYCYMLDSLITEIVNSEI